MADSMMEKILKKNKKHNEMLRKSMNKPVEVKNIFRERLNKKKKKKKNGS